MNQFFFILSTLVSFLLGFSLIAAIHELGHLLMAKWFGIRVNRYMVFFPPTLFKWHWKGTAYGIGSIPLGGFVEIEGMGQDTASLEKVPTWDFRVKPAWQRSLVMLGGILFNLISAYFIIFCLLMATGKPYLSKGDLNEHGVAPTALGKKVGFEKGDQIIQVNGHDFETFDELKEPLLQQKIVTYTVIRDDEELSLVVTPDVQQQLKDTKAGLWEPLIPYKIKKVRKDSPAGKAGLASGDDIINVNGIPTPYLQDLREVLREHRGGIVTIGYTRGQDEHTVDISLPKGKKLGLAIEQTLIMRYCRYTLAQGFWEGGKKVIHIIHAQLTGITKIIRGEVSFRESIQSPVAIAGMFGQYQGFTGFFWLIAFLSIILAIMNLLPIPALDGFHLLVNLCEALLGKRIPTHWHLKIQTLGALFLILLTVLLVLKDLYKLLLT